MDESELRAQGDEPTVEQTPERLLDQLASGRVERWRAALALAHAIDVGLARGGQYRAACVPVLVEVLEQHDDDAASAAEAAARRLVDIGERTFDVHESMVLCLSRAEDTLTRLDSELVDAPASEQATLRARFDAHCSLVTSLRGYLEDFRASPVASFAPPSIAAAAASRRPGKPGGGGAMLFALLLGVVLVGGGLTALLWSRKPPRAREVTLNAALTATPSAAPTRVEPPKHAAQPEH